MTEPEAVVYQDAVGDYANVAVIALFVYDTLITLDAEVKHIWSSPWTFGRISFHFNRIWGIVIICIVSYRIRGFGAMSLIFNITGIMALRVWVLYDQRTWTLNKLGHGSPLVTRLARDGTAYYLINLAFLAFAIILVGLGIPGYFVALQSILCTRMVLSLRAYEPGGLPTTQIKVSTLPGQFAPGNVSFTSHTQDSGALVELGDATTFSYETSRGG
ncbi:hypothetical protein FRC07_008968 [Ceratobasidium sp. 392]|nr:hypothetical protein FRC07_008968 [Ceratobasidium sp. 392]